MRIALLSTLERVADGSRRALMSLGGRALIAWQMDLAKALDCERLLVLSEGDTAIQAKVDELAQSAGMDIEYIGGPRHLLGKVTADQDILVLADGLLVDPELALASLGKGRAVATLPDYPAVEHGFERIDPQYAWAGLLLMKGQAAEQLAEMPADGDTVSLLLRLALQHGTRRIELDEMHLGTGEILLARTPENLEIREKSLLDHSRSKTNWQAPGEAVAAHIARALAPDALARGPHFSLGLGIALMSGALIASYFDNLLPGFVLLALGVFAIAISQALRYLRARLHGQLANRRLSMFINAMVDASFVMALAFASGETSLIGAIFVPAMLIGLWRMAAALSAPGIRPFWRDRTVLAVVLLLLVSFLDLGLALPVICLALLGFCLISEASARLTRA